MAKTKPPRVPESAEQAQLARSVGGRAYVLGTRRKRTDFQGTCQTPGVPDLLVFLPRRAVPGWQFLVIECKGQGGRLRTEQALFAELCRWSGIEHLVGGLDVFIAWLVSHEYVTAQQFPHYRQPKEATE